MVVLRMISPKSIEKSPPPVGNQIEKLFIHYDQYCFERGISEIIQRTKDAARKYTDELVLLNYDLKTIEDAIRLSFKDYPTKDDRKQVVFKVPPLTAILNHCKKLVRKNTKEPEKEIMKQGDWKKTWIESAKEGNPYAQSFVARNYPEVELSEVIGV